MAAIVVDENYVNTLKAFGDVNVQINAAVEEYVTRRVIERIKTAREHIAGYEQYYKLPFPLFSERVVKDENFYQNTKIENPLWEQDLLAWDYWEKEFQEWNQTLHTILNKS